MKENSDEFRDMHFGVSGEALVLPTVWDVSSAKVAVGAGYGAVGTSSGSIAESLGYTDHEGAPYREMVEAAARIIRNLPDIPVNVDFEAAYGLRADQVAEVISALGAAGVNIEDSQYAPKWHLKDAEEHARFIAKVITGLRENNNRCVVTARVDSMLPIILGSVSIDESMAHDAVSDVINRSQSYLESGADFVFPIGLSTERQFVEFFASIPPHKTSVLIPFGHEMMAMVQKMGVGRISFGTTLRSWVDEKMRYQLQAMK